MKYFFKIITIVIFVSCSENNEEESFTESSSINEVGYTITYNDNGKTSGAIPFDVNQYNLNDEAKVATNYGFLKKSQYEFVGWNTLADGTGKQYSVNDKLIINDSDVVLYAQWSYSIVSHQLVSDNQIIIIGLPDLPNQNESYTATVDFVNGKLALNQEFDISQFHFYYHNNPYNPETYGYLGITQSFDFSTAVSVDDLGAEIIILESGYKITSDLFDNFSSAEISGNFSDWGDVNNIFIAVNLTIDDNSHNGFLKVSFKDNEGLLTIHTIAYNKAPREPIITF